MAADFDKTSFGIQRRRNLVDKLTDSRQVISDRIGFVKDSEKLTRLVRLRVLIDAVLEDLKD